MTSIDQSVAPEDTDLALTSTTPSERNARALWSRLPLLWRVAAGMVGVQLLLRGWVAGGSYYFQDDFAHLDLARSLGLDRDYLVRDYGGHLEVGQYFLIWLLSHSLDESFVGATVSILVLQAVASTLLFYLLRTLFGDSPALLVPWAVYLYTPLAAAWTAWWAAAIQTLPLQITMMAAVLGAVNARRKGSARWAWFSVLAHAVGLVFWEKAVFILPAALAIVLLVVSSGGPRRRIIELLESWRLWCGHLAVLLVYAWIYFAVVQSVLSGERIDRGLLLNHSVFRMFIPGLFGGPWHADGAEHTLFPMTGTFEASVFLVALLALVVLSVAITGWTALLGWFLISGYVLADLTLLGLGRAEWLGLVARDPRYVADSLPVVAIGLAAAFRGLFTPPSDRPAAGWLSSRLDLVGSLKMVALILLSCYITTRSLTPVVQHEYPKNYVGSVLRQIEEYPGRAILNTKVPEEIGARVDLGQLLNAVGYEVELNRPSEQIYLFDSLANMRRMALFPGTEVQSGSDPACGWRLHREHTMLGVLPESTGSVRALRVSYRSTTESLLTVEHGDSAQSVPLSSGTGEVYFVLGQRSGTLLAKMDEGLELCVQEWAVGPAWVAD